MQLAEPIFQLSALYNKMKNPFEKFKQDLDDWINKELPKALAEEAIDFFVDQLSKGEDIHGKPYTERKPDMRKGGAVLQQRGFLRNSIRVIKIGSGEVTIAAGDAKVSYAQVHNEGAEIKVTDKMKSFFWAMYKNAGGTGKNDPEEALNWKYLALKKTGDTIKVPQREFIGSSDKLEGRLEEFIEEELNRIIGG